MRGLVPMLIVVLLLGWPAPAQAAPDGKVAVVDLLGLLEQHPDTLALRQKLQTDETSARGVLKEANSRLETLREELLALGDGPERRRKQSRFDKQRWNSEYDFKQMLRESQMTYVQELERIYAGVVAVVRNYARKNGIAVVLQMTDDEIGAVDRNDYVMKVALRTVVYYEPALDITEAVRALFPKAK